MDPLALAAPAAVVGGSLLVVGARRRIAFLAGVMVVGLLVPLCGRTLPTTAGWGFAAGADLVATLLGGLILLIGFRPIGARLAVGRWWITTLWLVAVAAAAVIGVWAWPQVADWLDPGRVVPPRAPNASDLDALIDPLRWTLGAGMAVMVAAVRQMLAPEATRLAAGAALGACGAWLIGIAIASPLPDLSLVALSLVLPLATAAAAWRTVGSAETVEEPTVPEVPDGPAAVGSVEPA